MIVNVQMDMVDRIGSYMFTAKFPFEYENDHALEVLHRGVDILNGVVFEKNDSLTEEGWEMYKYLLQQANKFLIQDVPTNHAACAEEIVNGILDEYSDGDGDAALPSELKRIASNLRKCIGIRKRANYGSKKYLEYTEKIAKLYSQIMKYDFENGEEILFDADAAFVTEWEEVKASTGEGKPTDLDAVKLLTKAYIRSFEIEPSEYGSVSHPIATMAIMPHPKNPRYGIKKPQEEIDAWIAAGNKEFLDLTDPEDFETWCSCADERIDAVESLEDICTYIIRGNWLDSWLGVVKEHLSFTDRQKVSATFEEHMKWVEEERERLFGKK